MLAEASPSALSVITTCFFHLGGFLVPIYALGKKYNVVFFPGEDLADDKVTDLLFKAVDNYKPKMLMAGSHHLVQLSKVKKPVEDLKLDSLFMAFPMGSTVPSTLHEDLRVHFPELALIGNFYSMTEIGVTLTMNLEVSSLGVVQKGVALKFVDPETGKLCGPNEV